MPSKKLKAQNLPSPWRVESDSSEANLTALALQLGKELKLGDRVLLEGPMGVGKTTFARALLHALGVEQPPEGSPTFAIAHEYDSPHGGVIHIDYYRLKSESEIDDAGIPSYYWERDLIVISEWLSSWPELEQKVIQSGRTWQVRLSFSDSVTRNVEIVLRTSA